MALRRREFVLAAAAGVLVYGLDRLAPAGEDAPKKEVPPPGWDEALAEMKAAKSLGVAILLPRDPKERAKLRADLDALLAKDTPFDAQIHLVEAVYVLVDEGRVETKEGENVVLLDADGKRIGGGKVDFAPAAFARTVRPLLRAHDLLAARAKAARTPEVEKLLAGLDDPNETEASRNVVRLAEAFRTGGPAVLDAYERSKPGVVRERLASVVTTAFLARRNAPAANAAARMPFGARWVDEATGLPTPDPCPACGEMMVDPRAGGRSVLQFLADAPRPPK